MARWTLECSDCHQNFTYTEIPATVKADPFLLWCGPKPEFPSGGMDLACPNCQHHSTYQRYELVFYTS
jgi:DNA-directed RNA polymerase subunit RPC12/RpoP